MKILQIMGGTEEGGLERHFVDLCNQLSTHSEHQVFAAAHPKYKERFLPGVHFLPMPLNHSRFHPGNFFEFSAIIEANQPDIVHSQGGKASRVVKLARVFSRHKPLFVATKHNLNSSVSEYKKFNHVVVVNKFLNEKISPQLKCTTIYNGSDLERFETAYSREQLAEMFGVSTEGTLAVAVGRMIPVKGFDELVHAWSNQQAQLLLVGDGSQRHHLEHLVDKLKLRDRVFFTGYRDDVPAILAGIDLCVISSRKEGFPYSMVEMLLARKPIISTPIPGALEVLPEQAIAATHKVVDLEAAISEGLKDPGELGRIFEPTFSYARESLTLEAMADNYLALYSELLAGS